MLTQPTPPLYLCALELGVLEEGQEVLGEHVHFHVGKHLVGHFVLGLQSGHRGGRDLQWWWGKYKAQEKRTANIDNGG